MDDGDDGEREIDYDFDNDDDDDDEEPQQENEEDGAPRRRVCFCKIFVNLVISEICFA